MVIKFTLFTQLEIFCQLLFCFEDFSLAFYLHFLNKELQWFLPLHSEQDRFMCKWLQEETLWILFWCERLLLVLAFSLRITQVSFVGAVAKKCHWRQSFSESALVPILLLEASKSISKDFPSCWGHCSRIVLLDSWIAQSHHSETHFRVVLFFADFICLRRCCCLPSWPHIFTKACVLLYVFGGWGVRRVNTVHVSLFGLIGLCCLSVPSCQLTLVNLCFLIFLTLSVDRNFCADLFSFSGASNVYKVLNLVCEVLEIHLCLTLYHFW